MRAVHIVAGLDFLAAVEQNHADLAGVQVQRHAAQTPRKLEQLFRLNAGQPGNEGDTLFDRRDTPRLAGPEPVRVPAHGLVQFLEKALHVRGHTAPMHVFIRHGSPLASQSSSLAFSLVCSSSGCCSRPSRSSMTRASSSLKSAR